MKRTFFKFCLIVLTCVCLCIAIAGCGSNKVTLEIYSGKIEMLNIDVELIIDENNICTFTTSDGYYMMGGKCQKNGSDYVFTTLAGNEIATAKLNADKLTLNYGGLTIILQKSVATFNVEKSCGAYKGYVDDGRPFEVCLILRPENKWFVIEEDGDINGYGKYELEGSLLTLTERENSEKYAYGTIDGDKISLNLGYEIINFQKI